MYTVVLYILFKLVLKYPQGYTLFPKLLLTLLLQREGSWRGSAEWDCLHQCLKRTGCQKGGTAQVFQDGRPEAGTSKSIRKIIISDLKIMYLSVWLYIHANRVRRDCWYFKALELSYK